MHSDERRKAIADVLRAADAPISASALAEKFSVSRQIIVGDIALLRSSGEDDGRRTTSFSSASSNFDTHTHSTRRSLPV